MSRDTLARATPLAIRSQAPMSLATSRSAIVGRATSMLSNRARPRVGSAVSVGPSRTQEASIDRGLDDATAIDAGELSEFELIRERMRQRDAWEAQADASERAGQEAQRDAERAAQERAYETVIDRRVAFELEFAAEVKALVAERGGTYATTRDVAYATANIATRWGRDYDRAAVQDAIEAAPVPVGDDYRPVR